MADIMADDRSPTPAAKASRQRRTAGIYGVIVTAAILDAAGGKLPTDTLVVSVVATLVVYWLTHEYAALLGGQAAAGAIPSWGYIRTALADSWSMVSAAYLPLLALVLTRVAGVSAFGAANAGLIVALVVLTVHAWLAGRAAQLRGRQLLFVTSIAAALGLAMIVLKDLILTHVH